MMYVYKDFGHLIKSNKLSLFIDNLKHNSITLIWLFHNIKRSREMCWLEG